jgi:hypothetical protein
VKLTFEVDDKSAANVMTIAGEGGELRAKKRVER